MAVLLSSERCSDWPSFSRSVRASVRLAQAPSSKLGRRPTCPESMLSPILPRPETPDQQSGNVPGPRLWMRDGSGDLLICNGSKLSVFMLLNQGSPGENKEQALLVFNTMSQRS